MKVVTIFDDDEKVASIAQTGDVVYVFAKSPRIWKEMNRLVKRAEPLNKTFMKRVIAFAHEYNYATELV